MLEHHGDKKIAGYYYTLTTPRSSSLARKINTIACNLPA